ncbi:MAG: hypothetical protein ACFB21_06670 [Opitutales bacterium]
MKRSIPLLLRLLACSFKPIHPADGVSILVFTKDRPLQLEALLRSMAQHVRGVEHAFVNVLWKASSEAYASGYRELQREYPGITFMQENQFRDDLIYLLRQSQTAAVVFLVDDLLFVNSFDLDWLSSVDLRYQVPSIRLDSKITYSQPGAHPAPPPPLQPSAKQPWLRFSWTRSVGPWAMPLSVDGNVFCRDEMLLLASHTAYRAPNSFEAALGPYRFWFKRRQGLCLPQRAIQNFALNRVQDENLSFACGDCGPEVLQQCWNKGERLDVEAMTQRSAASTHLVCEPEFFKKSLKMNTMQSEVLASK